MSQTELERARDETAEGIIGCVFRLSAAAEYLTLTQRMLIAEEMRNTADKLDRGRQLNQPHAKVRGRLVPTNHRDSQGRRLFRVVE
jgi:hypothetical protein